MKSITNRLDWVDWAKAIAIFLVVFGHMRSPLMGYIFSFHMPFFFLISGFLQKKRGVKTEFIRSVKSLLVPYVIFNIYLLIYSYFTGELTPEYPLSMVVGLQWNLSMAARPLWFLWSLFFCRLIHAALPQKVSPWMAIPCMVACALGNGTQFMNPETNYFQLWTVAQCYPFFVLGTLVKQYGLHQKMKPLPPLVRYPVLVALFASATYAASLNGGVNIFRCHPADNAWLFFLTASVMSFTLLVFIYHTLDFKDQKVRTISEGTLLIFAVHQSILWPLRESISSNMWLNMGIAFALISVFCYLINWCKRYAPVLIGKW